MLPQPPPPSSLPTQNCRCLRLHILQALGTSNFCYLRDWGQLKAEDWISFFGSHTGTSKSLGIVRGGAGESSGSIYCSEERGKNVSLSTGPQTSRWNVIRTQVAHAHTHELRNIMKLESECPNLSDCLSLSSMDMTTSGSKNCRVIWTRMLCKCAGSTTGSKTTLGASLLGEGQMVDSRSHIPDWIPQP